MYWGIVCPIYGISLFLPSIINELGYTATTAQLLTVPIYVVAAILAVVLGWFSDRAAKRGSSRWPYVFVPMCAILVGFIIAISASAAGGVPGVVYAGVFASLSHSHLNLSHKHWSPLSQTRETVVPVIPRCAAYMNPHFQLGESTETEPISRVCKIIDLILQPPPTSAHLL